MENKRDNFYDLRKYTYERADTYCNQKYGEDLPYSFHLKCVEQQGMKFIDLVALEDQPLVIAGLIGHENIEDFRMTYNDVAEVCAGLYFQKSSAGRKDFGIKVADIVYTVSDEKGKNRAERKNEKYYKELRENKLAVFVKLADLSANTLYSKLTGSTMYNKYKKEFPKFKEQVYLEEYKEFFDYVSGL